MLTKILVPLDGSKLAEIAIPVALRLARAAKAEIRFVLVSEPELSVMPAFESALVVVPSPEPGRERAATYLDQVFGRLEPADALRSSVRFLDGLAGPTLATEIDTWEPDLVVLASHGRGPFSRLWVGSVTDFLIRNVSVPLLVLKPKDDSDWSAEGDFKSIALAWDFSPLGEAILDPVTDLARSSGGTVELVHVLRPAIGPEVLDGAIYREWGQGEELREDAERDLAAIANRLGRRGISATARVEIGTTIAGTLVDLINHGPYDLIALTTHGRGGIQRALLGSVADKVIRGSDRPVLVLRPGP